MKLVSLMSFVCVVVHESGVLGKSDTSQAAAICQTGAQQRPPSRHGDNEVALSVTDVSYMSVASEIHQLPVPWMVPSTSLPSVPGRDVSDKTPRSLEQMSLPNSSSFQQHNVTAGAFQGLMPNVSLQSGFPGSSVAVFEVSSGLNNVQSSFLPSVTRGHEMPTTMAVPSHLPQMQPLAHLNTYLYDQEELALGKQQSYQSLVSAPDSFIAQQVLPQEPVRLPCAQPRPLTPLVQDNPAYIPPSVLHLDQQPVGLLLPRPVLPLPPPFLLTSGQPSNVPVAVRTPLAVVQETPTIELQPVPVLPMPTQFTMDPPSVPVPRPNLMSEQSAVKLHPSPMMGLLPPFLSNPPVDSRSAPHIILPDVPTRPPAVVQMPSLAPAVELPVFRQRAVADTTAGQIRLPVMPKSLLDIECHPVGRHLLTSKLVQEHHDVEPTHEPQNDADLRLRDTSDQLSAQLGLDYPGSNMMPRNIQPHSERLFSSPSKPLMAPGQMLEALQRFPAPLLSRMPVEPSRESLRIGMKPIRVSGVRSQELGRVPNVTLPEMEYNDLSVDKSLPQEHYAGSSFSSWLPAPSVVMASSQIIGSRLPTNRFQSGFRYHESPDDQHAGNASLDSIGPSSHLVHFASASDDVPLHQMSFNRQRVPSILQENLLNLSHSSSSGPMQTRWQKDRNGSGILTTVGELKAAFQQRDDISRRRLFEQQSSVDEEYALRSHFEPACKFMKCDDDIADEPKDVPQQSVSTCVTSTRDSHDVMSSSIDATSVTVTDASFSNSSS